MPTKQTTDPPPYQKQPDLVNVAPSGAALPGVVPDASDRINGRNINWDSPRIPDDKNKMGTPSDVVVNVSNHHTTYTVVVVTLHNIPTYFDIIITPYPPFFTSDTFALNPYFVCF